MNKLEIEATRESKISGLNAKNKLEIEDTRESKISGEQTNLTIKKQSDFTISLYNTEPQSIVIQRRSDTTITVFV
tara:strand:- start:192 stop:416 length:225 start_codon:yes stop_codon:yes gene_type:complete